VDNHYDNGPIVAQAVVSVADDETVESLSAKVQVAERALYPQVVNDFIAGLYHVEGRIVKKGVKHDTL
jgi:phosphoribosylglycinamide formyltransferase-1